VYQGFFFSFFWDGWEGDIQWSWKGEVVIFLTPPCQSLPVKKRFKLILEGTKNGGCKRDLQDLGRIQLGFWRSLLHPHFWYLQESIKIFIFFGLDFKCFFEEYWSCFWTFTCVQSYMKLRLFIFPSTNVQYHIQSFLILFSIWRYQIFFE